LLTSFTALFAGTPGLDGRDGIPGEPGLDGIPGMNQVFKLLINLGFMDFYASQGGTEWMAFQELMEITVSDTHF